MQPAREKAAALIAQRVAGLKRGIPIILIGDFNATAGANPAYDTLVNPALFSDTWQTAKTRRGELVSTFHGYQPPRRDGERIDWILTLGQVTADAVEIIQFKKDGQYPSDHFPVTADLRWGARASSSR